MPEISTVAPYWEPMMSSPVAATVSQNSAAPGLRMMSMPSTAGNHPAAGDQAGQGRVDGVHRRGHEAAPWDQAQKITPPAMAIRAATTMSTTRQV